MQRAAFEKLDVYRLSEKLADETWRLVLAWNPFARDTVGRQLVRAADSVGANIAEGYGRGTPKENHRFVRIGRGSLNETRHWLRRAYSRDLLNPAQISQLKLMLDELGPRLNAYLDSIDRSCARRPRKSATPNPLPTTNNKGPRTTES